MARAFWLPTLTLAEADDQFMRTLEDDTEEAPWMTMGDLQFWSASNFAHSLRRYARARGLGWYVAAMLPILYRWQHLPRTRQLAPDTFVAFADDHPRESFDADAEGGFPPFVLEVVSPSSRDRDRRQKRRAYRLLQAREYALFTPELVGPSTLMGYRRSASGRFVRWRPDGEGRLWSEVLGLYLLARGRELRAQTIDGQLLLTLEEAEAERQRTEAALQAEVEARRQAEAARQAEVEARLRAEAEVEQLRQEVARLRRPPAG